MLQTVDVLIGFSLVMLVLSIVVTMLVQFVVSMLLNLKGRVLQKGVAHLLNLLDKNGLTAAETHIIADHLLRNALVARKRVFGSFIGKEFALAQTIHREELIKLVLDFAGDCDLEKASNLVRNGNSQVRFRELVQQETDGKLDEKSKSDLAILRDPIDEKEHKDLELLRIRLLNSLRRNGIVGDPRDIIKDIRMTMLKLEKERPELASDVRQTLATVEHASSEFVAKINAWFDQTIDRAVESFTGKTRAWTTLFAAMVALFFQVDTFELLQRLSVDKESRQMLVDTATTHPEQFQALATMQQQEKDAAEPAKPKAVVPQPTGVEQPKAENAAPFSPREAIAAITSDPDLNKLYAADLIAKPKSFKEWWEQWPNDLFARLTHLIGLLVTVGLLTLGAPVWYEILKNLIQFRSLVSRKDDVERAARQSSQKPA